MSFYGNVTYYLSNAFGNMVYRNANSASKKSNGDSVPDGTASPSRTVAYEYTLSPRSRNDDMILETGNKWIVFGAGAQALQNNQISIYHQTRSSGAGGTVQTTVTAPPQNSQDSYDQLAFSSIVTFPTITFDEAGHITTVDTVSYQMADPPGLLELNSLKTRIATLESKIDGVSGEAGEGDVVTPPAASVNAQIVELQTKTNLWEMQQAYSGDPYINYKEQYGIGTTLHDLMVMIGIREAVTYTNQITGRTETGYQVVSLNNAANNSGCLYGKATQAAASATTAAVVAVHNRRGIRELINALYANDALTEQQATSLKDTYFDLTGL